MSLTNQYVESIFTHLTSGDSTKFFDHVNEDVNWLVTGDSHPLAKRWNSKQEFIAESYGRIGGILQKPMQLSIVNILVTPLGSGLKGAAVVELRGFGGVLKNGTYHAADKGGDESKEVGARREVPSFMRRKLIRDQVRSTTTSTVGL
jgi:hypothetical protein